MYGPAPPLRVDALAVSALLLAINVQNQREYGIQINIILWDNQKKSRDNLTSSLDLKLDSSFSMTCI